MSAIGRAAGACLAAVGFGLLGGCSSDPAGYDAPTAVCYDAVDDVYLVASRGGAAGAGGGSGYISRIPPAGAAGADWRFIQNGRAGVTLVAPAGIAVHDATLHVTDGDVLRRFDRTSGARAGEVTIPGAAALGPVTVASDGTIYLAGTGPEGGTIWRLKPGSDTPDQLAAGPKLGIPVGLVARPAAVYVVNEAGAFFQIDGQGRQTALGQVPTGDVTGLARCGGVYGIPSAAGHCAYRFAATGGVEALPQRLESPGACAFDSKRGLLLVPSVSGNSLASVPVPVR